MGLIGARRGTRIAWALLALVGAAAAIDGLQLWQQQRWNHRIEANRLPADADDLPLPVQFAQAYARAASGSADAALRRYRGLQDDTPLGQAARFNSANLLLRQAIAVRAGNQPGQAIALIELGKESLREVLRADPQHWAARYNLERAQRLLPDADELLEPAPPESKHDAERAATTMRGYTPGLP